MRILLCPLSDGGYLYPALAAGRELRRRGHHISVLGRSTAGPAVAEAGLAFAPAEDFGGDGAFSAARWGATGVAQYRATLRAARAADADLLVTSVLCNGTLLAAETLDLPVVVIGLAAHLWDYRTGGEGEPQYGRTRENRTQEGHLLYASVRERAGQPARTSRWRGSPLLGDALLLRGAPELEYPGAQLPEQVVHVGPLVWEPAHDPAELDEITRHLDRSGKPVVYVHLGRNFGGGSLWPTLNRAFTEGPFQAVVEQGRSTDPQPGPHADILLVRKPWMGPLIDLAGPVLASGTSAPVLASLLRGRPLALSPNGSEQPLLTAACLRAGVAVHLSASREHPAGPARVLDAAWRDDGLRDRARALGRRLAAVDSAALAADVVERTARTSAPRKEDHAYATSRP
ncbi:glycosyltransferase [Streptomyces sp. NPDC101178]|uniref:glycosyltransferase n=1 Tax=Streptomyces sp. NPDC101178 TaxID=3366124 RepID=UPI0038182376